MKTQFNFMRRFAWLGLAVAAYLNPAARAQEIEIESAAGGAPQAVEEVATNADWILIEGDILMPPDYDPLLRNFNNNPWPGGIVPFQWEPTANLTLLERAGMITAMDWWTTVSGVKFVFRDGEANYLNIQRSTIQSVSSSSVGMIGGRQNVNIWDSHWDNTGVVAHELCHALGFYHEQSRPDRDSFVTIEWDNIQSNYAYNFDLHADSLTLGNPYDYVSIMHYGSCSFSVCNDCSSDDANCRTITTNNPAFQSLIGQRDNLSPFDVIDMIDVYGARDARYVAAGAIGDGRLGAPYGFIALAALNTPVNGWLLIYSGSYNQPGTYSRAATWRVHGNGPVVIGQ